MGAFKRWSEAVKLERLTQKYVIKPHLEEIISIIHIIERST